VKLKVKRNLYSFNESEILMMDNPCDLHIRSIGKNLFGTNAPKINHYEPERRRTFVEHGEVLRN